MTTRSIKSRILHMDRLKTCLAHKANVYRYYVKTVEDEYKRVEEISLKEDECLIEYLEVCKYYKTLKKRLTMMLVSRVFAKQKMNLCLPRIHLK